jgi:hypothetical protein
VNIAYIVADDVPRYVRADQIRLQQLVCGLVRDTLIIMSADNSSTGSELAGPDGGASSPRGEVVVTLSLDDSNRALPERDSQRQEGGLFLEESVGLHIRVHGTTMTIRDEEWADLFDPFVANGSGGSGRGGPSVRSAKSTAVGLGEKSARLLSFGAPKAMTGADPPCPLDRTAPVWGALQVLWRQAVGGERRARRLIPPLHSRRNRYPRAPRWHVGEGLTFFLGFYLVYRHQASVKERLS